MEQGASRRGGVYQTFRSYLLDGDHWRAGRRFREGAPAVWTGHAMHPVRDPHAYTPAWEEHLEQVWVEHRIAGAMGTARARHERVEAAIREVEKDRPDEVEALRYYLLPERRRPLSVLARATADSSDRSTLWRRMDRAVELVWEELGGGW